MGRSILAQTIVILLTVQDLPAARPEIKTTWSGFQQQVTQGKLNNRGARISTSAGDEFKVVFLRTEGDYLVVRASGKTAHSATKNGEAMIPRESVSAVRFSGKIGRRGMIGGLMGLGAGAALAGAAASDMAGNCEGGSCGAVLIAIPMFAVAGYFIGHAADKSAPSFIIEQ